MFVNIYTICLVLSCVVFDVNSDENNLNYLEKKLYSIESSLEVDMHFLQKEVKENTEQITKLADLLNNTIQPVNSRSENSILNDHPINEDDQARSTRQYSDLLSEIKKVASYTFRNKRAILEEKQVSRDIYSKLATGIETIQTSLQESVKRAELFLEKSIDEIQNEIASKFNEIQISQSLAINIERIANDVSLIKLSTVLDTLKDSRLRGQRAHIICKGTDYVSSEQCDSSMVFESEINMSQLSRNNVRLINMADIPNGAQGRLEIFNNGEWGTVCDDDFDDTDAIVACKHPGYANGNAHGGGHGLGSAAFGQGQGKTWMDGVKCTGSESSLFQCPMNELGKEDCGHYEDVGVSCFK